MMSVQLWDPEGTTKARQTACEEEMFLMFYDKVSANGYISVPPRHQKSDAPPDVENGISTWFSESSDAQLSEYV